MLTDQQNQLLRLLDKRIIDTGVCPSYDEMKDVLGFRSKARVHELIVGLELRGFIRRIPGRKRAIEVIRLPGKAHITPSKMAEMVKAYDADWQAEFFECLARKGNA